MRRINFLFLVNIFIILCLNCFGSSGDTIEIDLLKKLMFKKCTMQHVILELGKPEHVYLSGEDEETYQAKSDDPVIFRYRREIRILNIFECGLLIEFDEETYRIKEISILFDEPSWPKSSPITSEEVSKKFGNKKIKYSIGYEESETDYTLCVSNKKNSKGECWIYKDIGLEVFVFPHDTREFVSSIRYNYHALKGNSSLPKCGE